MPATARNHRRRLRNNGVRFLSRQELDEYFDRQARKLVGLSGEEALDRIRKDDVGKSLAWTSLSLLAPLLLSDEE